MSGVVQDDQRLVRRLLVHPLQSGLVEPLLQQRIPAVEYGAFGPASATACAIVASTPSGVGDRDGADIDDGLAQQDASFRG